MEQTRKQKTDKILDRLMAITVGTPIALILCGVMVSSYNIGRQIIKGVPIEITNTFGRKETMIAIPTKKNDVFSFQGSSIFGRVEYIDKGGDGNLEEVILDRPLIALRTYSPGDYKRITNSTELQIYQQEYQGLYNKVRKKIPTGGFKLEPQYY